MDENRHTGIRWYTRRNGIERGPYPEQQVSRYILLGRIRDGDELRPEDGDWSPLSTFPELIPDLMKQPATEENLRRLERARLREDERRPRDRRADEGEVPADIRERRSGVERRSPESESVLRHRELRHGVAHPDRDKGRLYCYPAAVAGLVVVGLLLSYLLGAAQPEPPVPECGAQPRPGINWNGCNLAGLDSPNANLVGAQLRNTRLDAADLSGATLAGGNLEYAILNRGNLHNADLSHARLVGVAARAADLRDARLNHADLSYANLGDARLEGADLSGANLSHAIWVDHGPCLPGSIGSCKRARRAAGQP